MGPAAEPTIDPGVGRAIAADRDGGADQPGAGDPRRRWWWAAPVAVLVVIGWVLWTVVAPRFLPTHPGSSAEPLPDGPIEWVWSGGVTSTGAEVRLKTTAPPSTTRLAVATGPSLDEPTWVEPTTTGSDGVLAFAADGLAPDTTYHYAAEIDGTLQRAAAGSFRTFPEGPASFLVAFGGCARTGSNGSVYDAIAELDPILFGVVGDLHYGDIDRDDPARFRSVLDRSLSSPAQSALHRSTPIAYVWDDHDFGANNSDRRSPSRPAAMSTYRDYVPSYELAGPSSTLHQAFTIGRVRFVITDGRAGRDPRSLPDDADKSMLGTEQRAWLERELVEAAATHELVVWVQPVPWVEEVDQGSDAWGGYSTERRELAQLLVTEGVTNLVMVSGDAHMVAIDDGSNTDFSGTGAGGFPLLHVAALDQVGSRKGGPYSHGRFPGGGRFGTIEVIDDGATVEVVLAGRTWDGETLAEYRFTVT